jgi:subtilisin family serine protease
VATLLFSACGGDGSTEQRSSPSEENSIRTQRENKVEQCFIQMDEIALEDCESKYTTDSQIDSCLDDYEDEILDTCMLEESQDTLINNNDNTDTISDDEWWSWIEEQEENSAIDDKEDTKEDNEGNNEGDNDENGNDENRNDENNANDTTATSKIEEAKAEPYFKYAWHLDASNSILNSKGYQINEHADINVTGAWGITMGAGVKVAVIDDGADVNHEDLEANILIAYNADTGGENIQTKESHGNTCAGFIVAPVNGKGIVGVSPESKMIAIKLEDSSDAYTIRAFEYAKKHGAKVISCSWGSNNVSDAVVSELKSLYNAGVTVLFASGNEGSSLDVQGTNDESEVEWVIGVGASGENNDVTNYSNYGKNIDIIAPGGDTQESIGVLGLDDMGESGYPDETGLINNNYLFANGTSFSTPITAGVVAMMYAVNPNITPKQVKEILTSTATKVGQDTSASYNGQGFDKKRAYGKINAGRAVVEAQRIKI